MFCFFCFFFLVCFILNAKNHKNVLFNFPVRPLRTIKHHNPWVGLASQQATKTFPETTCLEMAISVEWKASADWRVISVETTNFLAKKKKNLKDKEVCDYDSPSALNMVYLIHHEKIPFLLTHKQRAASITSKWFLLKISWNFRIIFCWCHDLC